MDTNKSNEQLERDIVNALRARGLREQMQAWDEEDRKNTQALDEKDHKQPQTIVPLWPRLRKVVYPVAIAAMLCGVIWTAVPTATWDYGYKWTTQQYARYFKHNRPRNPQPQQQELPETFFAKAEYVEMLVAARYCDVAPLGADEVLQEAMLAMRDQQYERAQPLLEDAAKHTDTESIRADIELMEALCNAHMGKTKHARKQLEQIASEGGRNQQFADDLLN